MKYSESAFSPSCTADTSMPPKMKRRAGKVNAERDKNLEIPEDEQWRIVEQSGVLRRASTKTQADRISSPNISSSEPTNETGEELSEDDPNYFCDEIFNSILMIIPFSFLLLLMDVYVRSFPRAGGADDLIC